MEVLPLYYWDLKFACLPACLSPLTLIFFSPCLLFMLTCAFVSSLLEKMVDWGGLK